jgi:hypothetical protein
MPNKPICREMEFTSETGVRQFKDHVVALPVKEQGQISFECGNRYHIKQYLKRGKAPFQRKQSWYLAIL